MGETRIRKKMKLDMNYGDHHQVNKIKGTVVLTKKKLKVSPIDWFNELIGRRKVYLQLISAVNSDPTAKELRGKLGNPAHLENWSCKKLTFNVTFDWDAEIGLPGAFLIRNLHSKEFYLKTLTLENVPNHGHVHFICNSWVYPAKRYKKDRVFFSNQTCLPRATPAPLRYFREEELKVLRGNGSGKLEKWDRVYDYDVYNDLADPDVPKHVRPTLGGSTNHPYPRRGRTGRPPTVTDPSIESRLPLYESLEIYVPRDERFSDVKMQDVVAYGLKLIAQSLIPGFEALLDKLSDKVIGAIEHELKHKFESVSDKKFNEFESFDDVLKLFECGIKLPHSSLLESVRKRLPSEVLKELFRSDGERLLKFPEPHVIKEDSDVWRTDEEFAREMLAGLNPVVIRRLQTFPPTSKLDPILYGNQNSTMTEEHIKDHLDGLDVNQAIESNRLYILDHHDPLMPYLRGINETSTRTYATRTILFLQKDGTLKPLAIELSLPNPECDQAGAISKVYTPRQPEDGAEGTIWQLAKAYVAVNDSGYHQLICHWLHTHASIEPFIIATNRQLSVLHPINKLLHPHFRDTMNINAVARQTLINAGGLLENTVFPEKYAMEMSSTMYREWVFPDEALPADLIKRGVAVEDSNSPHGIRLLIEDYPYASDGLEIWSAIKTWVQDYCSFYYVTDEEVQNDCELQSWWEEVKNRGHGDKKDEPWWPKMQTRKELVESCTIITWVASALHAAVNFGQYPYGGYLLNRPSMSRRLIPEPGTEDYIELETHPEKALLKTVTPQLQSILGISLIEILSRHSADEVFLGQRDTPEWTKDREILDAFENFGKNLAEVEKKLMDMNKDEKLKNRTGPVKMPYTLLYPSSEVGLTFRGIPNSVTI